MKRLIIIGAGGHGKVIADAAEELGWDQICFLDERFPALRSVGPWDVIGTDQTIQGIAQDCEGIIVGIGDNQRRLSILDKIIHAGLPVPSIIHPRAVVSRYSQIEQGSVVFAHATINVDASIARGSIINTGSVIEHDCRLAAGVHVSPLAAISGGVTVGERTWIGVGACVRQRIKIGKNVTVGAGATVVCDIRDHVTVIGTPAREIAKKKPS